VAIIPQRTRAEMAAAAVASSGVGAAGVIVRRKANRKVPLRVITRPGRVVYPEPEVVE